MAFHSCLDVVAMHYSGEGSSEAAVVDTGRSEAASGAVEAASAVCSARRRACTVAAGLTVDREDWDSGSLGAMVLLQGRVVALLAAGRLGCSTPQRPWWLLLISVRCRDKDNACSVGWCLVAKCLGDIFRGASCRNERVRTKLEGLAPGGEECHRRSLKTGLM